MEDNNKFNVQTARLEGTLHFGVNEWPCECSPDNLRDALIAYREKLVEMTNNLDSIIQSQIPEHAERMMLDNAIVQVSELVITAPTENSDIFKEKIDVFLQDIIDNK